MTTCMWLYGDRQPNIGLDLPNTALRAVSSGHCACFSVFAAQPTVERT